MMLRRAALLLAVLAAGATAACSKSESPTTAAPSAAIVAAEPGIQRLYDQTCKSCHSVPGTGAPQVGDRAAWEPRVAQGMETLLNHTINGFRGMPPLGSCGDCSEADFSALIRYMAQMP
ncbi:MAG TPA: c-type cytochrome [Fontimonas sp.]